jgi:regulator of protease activity HflC (stomatin/prohibitin superfamily)
MKRTLGSIFTIIMAFFLVACTNVDSGYVGVKVEKYGDNRGVQNEILGPGRYVTGPNTDIFSYPTFTKTETWTRSPSEGRKQDESISFSTKGGVPVNADFGVSFHIAPTNVPVVFQKYRADLDVISDTFFRNMVRDSLNEIAGSITPDDILNDKAAFMTKVNAELIKRAAISGITVESLSAIGNFRWPPEIEAAMTAKITATQKAIAIENQLRSTEAENKKQIANAETNLKIADLDAQATAIKGKALASNPAYLQQLWIEKWDGKVSTVSTNGSSQIQIPASLVGK